MVKNPFKIEGLDYHVLTQGSDDLDRDSYFRTKSRMFPRWPFLQIIVELLVVVLLEQ